MNNETIKIGKHFGQLTYSARGWWRFSVSSLNLFLEEEFYSRGKDGEKKFTESDIDAAKQRIIKRARKEIKRAA